ncbi:MAG: GNAT family N-acetyltransferase [Alphaproteobacteria bacterium]|nr:GNAT family N-acetyltransferase [Alphaproteobacteria bacterium]
MALNWSLTTFDDLTPAQLYDILRLRIDVFMLEQNVPFSETDGKDAGALHLTGYDGTALACYTRIFPPGHKYDGHICAAARIGRVVTCKNYRGKGLGHVLIKEAIRTIEEKCGATAITLNGQEHLQDFYAAHGFVTEGDIFIEDDIPHVKMTRKAAS